jgi:CDP-glycerol glycerophosphotransferase (TagB/SpsB family)
VLGIRGHANVRHLERYADAADSPDIISLNHYPDVNVLLRDTAVLITDYSSIYLDFLLTGRPILHFAYDFEAYLEKRVGFFYEVKEAFAGPVPRNFGELVHALDQALGSGVSDPESYGRVRDLFHQHPSGSAAEVGRRILALVRSRSEGGPDGTSIASPPADSGGRGEEHG